MVAKVEIYGTSNCKKCVDVRELLNRKKVEYLDYLIDLMPLEKDEMIRRTRLKYYPQIFVNDQYIGSRTELLSLELNGELDKILDL